MTPATPEHSDACRLKGLWMSPGRIADTDEKGRVIPPGQTKGERHAPAPSARRRTRRRRARLDARVSSARAIPQSAGHAVLLRYRFVPGQTYTYRIARATLSSSGLTSVDAQRTTHTRRSCWLHTRDGARVNLKPSRYVGRRVDIVGNMYNLQVMDGYVENNTNLDANGSNAWDVFAQDYADAPPSMPENTYVEIKGTIDAAAEAYRTLSGGFVGYVPQVRVAVIRRITASFALKMGMPAH